MIQQKRKQNYSSKWETYVRSLKIYGTSKHNPLIVVSKDYVVKSSEQNCAVIGHLLLDETRVTTSYPKFQILELRRRNSSIWDPTSELRISHTRVKMS